MVPYSKSKIECTTQIHRSRLTPLLVNNVQSSINDAKKESSYYPFTHLATSSKYGLLDDYVPHHRTNTRLGETT
jgi:hypothetical protein